MHPHDLDDDERAFVKEAGVSPSRGTCPDPALLGEEVRALLPTDAAAAVEAHVAQCSRCRHLAAELAAVEPDPLTAIEQRRLRARIDKRIGRHRVVPARRGFALAAGLALAATVLLSFVFWRTAAPLPSPRAVVLPAPPPFSRPLPSAERVFALSVPAVELPPAALVVRGAAGDFSTQFLSGVQAYREASYQTAAMCFAVAADARPAEPHAWFYLGVSRLLAGDAAGAVGPLQAAQRLGAGGLSVEATWYLSLALERTGRTDAAIRTITPLCGVPGPHAVESCAALEVLSRSSR